MNEQATARDTEQQAHDYPPLTVLPIADDPTRFYVLGESGWWYEATFGRESEPATCECPHRRHRAAFCKHLQAVERYVSGGWPSAAEEAMSVWRAMSEEERKGVFR